MERAEIPKLKKAVVTLQKLDLTCEVPVAGNGKEMPKETAELFDNEDPSSISTGSVESNVVCTDDDDLEKKIQAFSIPVKKDEKLPNAKNENENSKNCTDKSCKINEDSDSSKLGGKHSDSSKLGGKQSLPVLKFDAKLKEKCISESVIPIEPSKSIETTTLSTEIENISSGTKRKREKSSKSKLGSESEDKLLIAGNRVSVNKQKKLSEANTTISADLRPTHDNVSFVTNGKEGECDEKVTFAGKKTQEDEQNSTQNQSARRSEVLRKTKAQEEEGDVDIEPKKLLKRKYPKNPSKTDVSTPDSMEKKKNIKTVEVKTKTDTTKKKVLHNSPSLTDNDCLKVKRSSRISSRSKTLKDGEKSIREKKKLEVRSQNTPENKQTLRVVTEKQHSSSKDKRDNSLKLKYNKTESNKVNGEEKRVGITQKQSITHSVNSSEPKVKNVKVQQNKLNAKNLRTPKQTSVTSEKQNNSNAKAQKTLSMKRKSISSERNMKNKSSDILDEGEELLEKICDILEDSSGVSECNFGGGKRNNMPQDLQSIDRTITASKECVLIPQPSFVVPKMLNKTSKFPSHTKGTISYKKLWKWSHYVRMPSDMWSLYKHFNGNFVVILHISETSPFPNLFIDKCVIFKETASPLVKIYGKDIDALGSKEELQTLGQVCSFLKHIHGLSLCEGRSVEGGESNNNCELYTDKNISLPYKCKSCSCS